MTCHRRQVLPWLQLELLLLWIYTCVRCQTGLMYKLTGATKEIACSLSLDDLTSKVAAKTTMTSTGVSQALKWTMLSTSIYMCGGPNVDKLCDVLNVVLACVTSPLSGGGGGGSAIGGNSVARPPRFPSMVPTDDGVSWPKCQGSPPVLAGGMSGEFAP